MKKNYLIAFCALTALFSVDAAAVFNRNDDSLAGAYSYWGGQPGKLSGAVPLGEFIVAGGAGKAARGTHGDEYGLVGVIATDHLTKEGANFCTVQIQCANSYGVRDAWTTYHFPSGGKEADGSLRCYTLCKAGFTAVGAKCVPVDTLARFECNTAENLKSYLTTGIGMAHSGDNIEGYVSALYSWYYGDHGGTEYDVVLGVTKFVPHGAFVAPIGLHCGRDNWKSVDSFIGGIYVRAKKETLLCMAGYTPEPGDDPQKCVEIDRTKCDFASLPACGGVDESKFDDATHKWVLNPTGTACKMMRCKHDGYAFTTSGDYACAECGDGTIRYGVDASGMCIECKGTKLFDSDTKACTETKTILTKEELQYGKGHTRNSNQDNRIQDQCWYHVKPDTYRGCVIGCPEGQKWEDGGCVSKTGNAPDGSALDTTGTTE